MKEIEKKWRIIKIVGMTYSLHIIHREIITEKFYIYGADAGSLYTTSPAIFPAYYSLCFPHDVGDSDVGSNVGIVVGWDVVADGVGEDVGVCVVSIIVGSCVVGEIEDGG